MAEAISSLSPAVAATVSPKYQEFKTLFAEYEAALLEKSPHLPAYLEKVRSDLHATPEICWLLSDEQIGVIVSGQMQVSGVEIAAAAKAAKKESGPKMSLADALGLG